MSENQALIDGLRQAADFIEANDVGQLCEGVVLYRFFKDKDDFAVTTKGLGRLVKKPIDSYYTLSKMFPAEVEIQFTIGRDLICEKIVTKQTVAYQPAIPEHEVDSVKWVCPDSILQKLRGDLQASADAWVEPRRDHIDADISDAIDAIVARREAKEPAAINDDPMAAEREAYLNKEEVPF